MIGNHGIFSTHDTGNAYCFFCITDHQYIFIQLTFLSVQRHKFFTCSCTADNNLFSFNRIQIIGVHRLSVFFHHIIRNIYKIIDRTDSIRSQASLHPLRRRTDLDIFYNSCTVTNSFPKVAAASRAIPRMEKQSTRLDVISYSTTLSSSPK